MKNMLLLIDFSPMSNLVIKQALILAKLNYNKIIFCHVSNSNAENKINEINESFKPFLDKASDAGVPYQIYIPSGNLVGGVQAAMLKFNSDIVVAGTHGKQGIL